MKDKYVDRLVSPDAHSITRHLPKFLSPIFSFVVLHKILYLKLGETYNEFLFKTGKSLGKSIAEKLKDFGAHKQKSELIRFFLKEFENLGFGHCKIKLLNVEASTCVISNLTNPISKQHKRTFGIQKEAVDFFIAGLYSGGLSKILNKDCFFIEKECISRNENSCVFHLSFDCQFKHEKISQEEIDKIINWENLHSEYGSKYPNTLIQKIIQLKQIQLYLGELKVWNIYCVFFPIDIYLVTYEFFKMHNVDLSNELCYLGIVQAKIAILFQVNKFGIKNGIATFNSIVNQLEFFGFGKGKLIESNEQKLVVHFKNSYAIFQYRAMFRKVESFDDVYVKGILIGAACYAFGKNLGSIGQDIKNNDIVYTFLYTTDKKNSVIENYLSGIRNKKITAIIEERMKHKYYLLT